MAGGLSEETDKLFGFFDKNRELSPSQIDYEVGAFAPILLSEGLNTVLIRFTPEQYTKLLSSAITGAFISYPENPLNVVFPLLECVDMPISNCAEVADCIESNELVKDALSDWFKGSEYNESLERALEGLASQGTGFDGSITCDDDKLFGSITAVFDELNQSAIDWLEILDASAQLVELLSEWGEELVALSIASGGTWAVATAIIAVIADVVEQFILDLYQNYQASYSTELRDELRCEFFCFVKDNGCTYTALDILNWLEPQVNPNIDDLLNLVSWFFGLSIDISRQTVLRMWYFELKLYQFAITNTLASLFAGQPARDAMVRLTRVSQASEPDNDWTVFCESCDPLVWEKEFNFLAGTQGWRVFNNDNNQAQYVAGEGWRRRLPSGGLNGTRLRIESPVFTSTLKEVVIYFSYAYTLSANGGVLGGILGFKGGALSAVETFTGESFISGRGLVQIANSPTNSFPIANQLPSNFYIQKIVFKGLGVSPF